MTVLTPRPLTQADFEPFGDVIELRAQPDKIINQGMCGRHHDLAALDFADGRAGISLFDAEARHLPCEVALVERHLCGFANMFRCIEIGLSSPQTDDIATGSFQLTGFSCNGDGWTWFNA